MQKTYYVYIMTNHPRNTVLYIGVTNNIFKRNEQHNLSNKNSFTKRYNVNTVIYGETSPSINEAILREKQLKSWTRAKKIALIKNVNPNFDNYFL